MTGKNDTPSPPQWMDKLLEWFCAEEFLEIVQGDLHELYHRDVKERGRSKAKLHYLLHVLDLFRPFALGFSLPDFHYLTSTGMYKSYFTTAFRNFRRQFGFSLINILGLAIGMAAFMIILTYVSYELSYDDYHTNRDHLFRWNRLYYKPGDDMGNYSAKTMPPFANLIKESMPEVKEVARLYRCPPQTPYITVSYVDDEEEKTSFNEDYAFFADPSFLSMFNLPMVVGDTTALYQPNTIVLSESTAIRYFGRASEAVLGETLQVPYKTGKINDQYVVTGIYRDLPANTHLRADMLLSYRTLSEHEPFLYEDSWHYGHMYTYVQLHSTVSEAQFREKINQYVALANERYQSDFDESFDILIDFNLIRVNDIHVYSESRDELTPSGNSRAINFLLIISLLIILIAWVNYVNLTTAKAVQRAREVGVRKVAGASRGQLVLQFLSETLIINLLATLIALLIIGLGLPFFRQLTGTPLSFSLWWDGLAHPYLFWWLLGALFLISTVLSGFYPALVLSSFQPLKTLRGRLLTSTSGAVSLRSGLVVVQFTISVILIAGTYLMYQQMQYMQNQPLGFDSEQTLVIQSPTDTTLKATALEVFKEDLLRQAFVENVSTSSTVPGHEVHWGWPIGLIQDKYNNGTKIISVDDSFIETHNFTVLAGRNFSEDHPTDKEAVLLNETLVRELGFESPEAAVHQEVWLSEIGKKEVIGIVQDYHQSSLKEDYGPICFLPEGTTAVGEGGTYPYDFKDKDRAYLSVKIGAADLPENLTEIEQTYQSYFPGYPFQYFFLDEHFNQQYKSDHQFGKIFGVFAGLSIFIACLGILGLSSYLAVQKSKEIGIRKVLGATISHIVLLLSGKFVRLVLLATLIALPVAYLLFKRWLENYAFRIEIRWWYLVIPALVVIIIAIMTITVQTIKAALANPVDSIKYE